MRFLNRKFPIRILHIFLYSLIFLFTIRCSNQIREDLAYDIYRNEQQIQSISSLEVLSNIIINSKGEEAKLYGGFNYNFPDNLKIQFRDPLGRKQALMSFNNDDFILWLQRENKRYNRNEIPTDFSLFVFQELNLNDIRKLFLGRPLFEVTKRSAKTLSESIEQQINKDIHTTTYFNNDKTIRRVEIIKNNSVSTIIIYSNWESYTGIYFPENIHIVDLDSNVELQIKLYHYSPKYINLSSL